MFIFFGPSLSGRLFYCQLPDGGDGTAGSTYFVFLFLQRNKLKRSVISVGRG